MKNTVYCILVVAVFFLLFPIPLLAAERIPIIDAHAHLDHAGYFGNMQASLDAALSDMQKNGLSRSILMPPPQVSGMRFGYDLEELAFAIKKHSKQFAIIGGGGILNPMIHDIKSDKVSESDKRRFRAEAEKILQSGARGFGEIAVHHLSHSRMGPNHPYESVAADHPLLLLLADIAAEKGVPIDLHLDPVFIDMKRPEGPFNPATPEDLKANIPAFERLLEHNRRAIIIWAHAGTDMLRVRIPDLQRDLLKRHPNLYMSLRIGPGGPDLSFASDRNGQLRPEWRQLLIDFTDRFMVGSDSFHPPAANARRTPAEALERTRVVLDQLPEPVARAIAYENAVRIYRLPVE